MSTNHRPRLETKKGLKRNIDGSISHSRNLPQQMNLKYRQDLPFQDKTSDNEQTGTHEHNKTGNTISIKDQGEKYISKEGDSNVINKKMDGDKLKQQIGINDLQEVSNDQVSKKKDDENKDEEVDNEDKEEDEQAEDEEDDDDDDDSEDEEDAAELLKELENLRRSKEQETTSTKTSVPKKSWRSSKKFKKSSVSEEFTNDSISSKYHQDFLNNYIK